MQHPHTDIFSALRGSILATGMSDDQVRELEKYATLQTFDPGQTLVAIKDPSLHLLLIVSGKCEVWAAGDDLLYSLSENSLVGEVSFVDGEKRSASVTAVTACDAIRFERKVLDQMSLAVSNHLLRNVCVVVCRKLRSTTKVVEFIVGLQD